MTCHQNPGPADQSLKLHPPEVLMVSKCRVLVITERESNLPGCQIPRRILWPVIRKMATNLRIWLNSTFWWWHWCSSSKKIPSYNFASWMTWALYSQSQRSITITATSKSAPATTAASTSAAATASSAAAATSAAAAATSSTAESSAAASSAAATSSSAAATSTAATSATAWRNGYEPTSCGWETEFYVCAVSMTKNTYKHISSRNLQFPLACLPLSGPLCLM